MHVMLVFTELNQKFGALRSQHGLASISAVLKSEGIRVSLGYFADELDIEQWQRRISEAKPDVIGFYSTAEQFHHVRALIEAVPSGLFTVLGGPHAICFPNCIEQVPRLDAVCTGEGEYAMLELAQALQDGREPTHIAGFWVRHHGALVRNPPRPFIEDLNALPYEDRELFDTQKSINQYGMAQMRIITSRGCPYDCTYCSNKRMSTAQPGRYVRFRSAKHILGELSALQERFAFEELYFDDDIFMMNRKVVDEFCERYPSAIGKPFVFCGRVEMCHPDVLRKLKKAGGRRIDLGLESGNEEIRRNVLKRRMTNGEILEATQAAKSAGLQVKTFNMVGLPEETLDNHMDTVRLNRVIRPDVASIFVFYPYPGTEAYDWCVRKGYLTDGGALPEDYVSRRQSILELPGFPREEIARCFRKFGFRVFRKSSPIKAIGYSVIYSNYGEFALRQTRHMRLLMRRVLPGF